MKPENIKPENIKSDRINPEKTDMTSVKQDCEVRVYKSKKKLELWEKSDLAGKCIQEYAIGIGADPIGTKLRAGDNKTPEGEYEICVKNPNSKYHLSLGLNYPNKTDLERGLNSGVITESLYKKLSKEIKDRNSASWYTPLGGEIFIHGHLEERDWSEGCIRMYNKDIEQLYQLVEKGTVVKIFV